MKPFYKNKIFWIIVIVVVILVVVTVIYAKVRKNRIIAKANESIGPETTIKTVYTANTFPLKTGSRGSAVKDLQAYLNNLVNTKYPSYPKLIEDGIFGQKTLVLLQMMLGIDSVSENFYNTRVKTYIERILQAQK